jgi:hypothetical protein
LPQLPTRNATRQLSVPVAHSDPEFVILPTVVRPQQNTDVDALVKLSLLALDPAHALARASYEKSGYTALPLLVRYFKTL